MALHAVGERRPALRWLTPQRNACSHGQANRRHIRQPAIDSEDARLIRGRGDGLSGLATCELAIAIWAVTGFSLRILADSHGSGLRSTQPVPN